MDRNSADRSDAAITDFIALGTAGKLEKDRTILVPLDGSGLAETVIPHAIGMAAAMRSKLRLLRVAPFLTRIEPIGTGFTPSPSVLEAWAEEPDRARRYLSGLEDLLNKRGLSVDTVVLEGDPARSIVEYAKEHPEVAMIAMSTHGRNGIRRWIMGSVAEKVLHASPVPLLLVRAEERDTPVTEFPEYVYRTILVPLDGSSLAEQALEEVQALAARLSATLLLVSVIPPLERWEMVAAESVPFWVENAEEEQTESVTRYLQVVAERLRAKGLKVQQEVAHGEPAEQILRRSEPGADLIAISSHGRSGLQRLWLGSVAMKVVDAANVPVLVVRATEDPARKGKVVGRQEDVPVPA
jgi:nucleotide-binding universal stress UspA family protein